MKPDVLVIHCGTLYLDHVTTYLKNWGVNFTVELPFNHIESNYDALMKRIKDNYDALIYAGGTIPGKISKDVRMWSAKLIRELDIPFLGICLGHIMLGFAYGPYGPSTGFWRYPNDRKGITEVSFNKEFPLAPGRDSLTVYQHHERTLTHIPKCLESYGSSLFSKIEAIKHKEEQKYSVQFHAEVTKDENGDPIDGHIVIDNFLRRV